MIKKQEIKHLPEPFLTFSHHVPVLSLWEYRQLQILDGYDSFWYSDVFLCNYTTYHNKYFFQIHVLFSAFKAHDLFYISYLSDAEYIHAG